MIWCNRIWIKGVDTSISSIPYSTASYAVARELTYAHDGPLTPFVLIARAMDLTAGITRRPDFTGELSVKDFADLVANVLWEELNDFGYLSDRAQDREVRAYNSAD